MFSWLKRGAAPTRAAVGAESDPEKRRVLEIGWLLDTELAGFLYEDPRPIGRKGPPPANAKALPFCPAVLDYEKRYHEVLCPFDLRLRLATRRDGSLGLVNAAGSGSAVSPQYMSQVLGLLEPQRWTSPKRPLLQVATPYRFLADEPVWMEQLPPFNVWRREAWPGLVVGGRIPIHLWPRKLVWTFEWRELERELVLKRGEPWFYLKFECDDPTRPLRIVEPQLTEPLRRYCQGLDGATDYSSRTAELLATAGDRRPKTLLMPVER